MGIEVKTLSTDVLVVGGGTAGVFAAYYAKQHASNVILVDKGKTGFSGLSPWYHAFAVYDKDGTVTKDEWMKKFLTNTEYMTNPDYVEHFFTYSKQAWDDMVSWGATGDGKRGPAVRNKLLASGVTLVERTMIVELLKDGDRVIGAIGLDMAAEAPVVIYAKNVILCTGAGTFKGPGWPSVPNAFDGHIMAYQAGATLAGKEWNDFHCTNTIYPSYVGANCKVFGDMFAQHVPAGHSMNHMFWCGRNGIHTEVTPEMRIQASEGRKPPKAGNDGKGAPPPKPDVEGPPRPGEVVGAACGASEHRCDGVFPVDNTCFSGVPGLYAAGDALCTGGVGLLGSASPGCAVQGIVSGEVTGKMAKDMEHITLDEATLQGKIDGVMSMMNREIGYSGQYVVKLVQSIMMPYYVLFVKEESRLQAALSNILYLKSHFVPRLIAHDIHELRVAYEATYMIINAEMKLRASLFRTESRASHFREDVPVRDDENWLAWVTIKETDEGMTLKKQPLDPRSMPVTEESYFDRYENRFPGELDYLSTHNS